MHLPIICSFRFGFSVAIAFAAASFTHAQTNDSSFYGITRALNYVQTSAAAPVLASTNAGRFEAFSDLAGSLRLPNGTTQTYTAGNGIERSFPSAAALEAAFPAGTYTMTVGAVSGISLTIPANSFPADIPRLVGGTWNAAGRLVVDPTKDYIITLNPFTGFNPPGGLGHASLEIFETPVERRQFSSGNPTMFTTVTIPAGTLVAGRTYTGNVGFVASPTLNTTSIPGSFGVVVALNETEFQIAAVAPANAAPTIVTQPASRTIAAGGTTAFSFAIEGVPAPTYQWRRGTSAIPGATGAVLTLGGPTASTGNFAATAGNYSCVVTNSLGSVTTADAVLTVSTASTAEAGRLINLSVLAPTGPGAQLLTMGATVGGSGLSGPLPLVIRGVGPTLGTFGVGGVLADPVLSIFPAGGSTPSATNDNWGGTSALVAAFAGVGAFPLPATSLDSAVFQNQTAGGFTVQVAGKAGATGSVIAEVYDAAGATRTATTPRLVNLSVLTAVGPAATLTAGFAIGGATARSVLVRAVGPTLATAFALSSAMTDPKLELFNNDTGAKIAENDNWSNSSWLREAQTAVGAFALGGAMTKDAALLVTLAPGAYSARVAGLNGGDGTVIIEVYEVP